MLQAANTNCPELKKLPHHGRSRVKRVRYHKGVALFGKALKAMLDLTAMRLTYTPGPHGAA